MPLLSVKNLSISFANTQVVQGISFQLFPKKITALVGQSGSGKSVTALAIVRLLRKAEISGEILWTPQQVRGDKSQVRDDESQVRGDELKEVTTSCHPALVAGSIDLLQLTEKELCKIRGKEIGLVFQDPNSALNPLHKIGKQIAEAITIHNPKISKINLEKRVLELLKMVELESFDSRLNDYPHQLSGGQKQRVMIAIALANNPKILIADEPTTALDVTIQNEILNLILRLKNELNLSVLFISHNLCAVKKIADEVIEMKEGRIAKSSLNILQPSSLDRRSEDLVSLTSDMPNSRDPRTFGSRMTELGVSRMASGEGGEPILDVKNLSVTHQIKKTFFQKENFYANRDLNFSLQTGRNLGVIGESGSGKSTLALALLNLIPCRGEINFFGEKTWAKNNFELRRDVQIIFQDPFSSLDPRMLVGDIIAEGLLIHGPRNKCGVTNGESGVTNGESGAEGSVDKVMKKLGLDPSLKNRYPHQLSGGQRQRVAIARALILNPKILVLDEPTSALDTSTQNEILKLLSEIQATQNISYILISHDLEVVSQIADQIMVLKDGQIVELGEKSQIINSPQELYTKSLVSHFKN